MLQFKPPAISNKSVKTRHIDVLVKTANIFDKTAATVGQRLNGTVNTSTIANTTQSWGASYATTGLIEFSTPAPSINLFSNKQLSAVYFFDVNGVYRGSNTGTLQGDGSYKYSLTSGIYQFRYVRAEYQTSIVTDANALMISLNSLPTQYQAYGSQLELNGKRIATYEELPIIPKLPAVKEQSTGVFVGEGAGQNNAESTTDDNGKYNTSLGIRALQSNTAGHHNTAVGFQTMMKNTTGQYNTAYGEDALYNTTTGSYNTAVGIRPMQDNTIGNRNVAVGSSALWKNIDGNNNTVIGTNAGPTITTEDGNILLGYATDVSVGVENAIVIGRSALGTKSDTALIGNASTKAVETHGDFETLTSGKGFVLKSPNGSKFRITVSDAGVLSAAPVV